MPLVEITDNIFINPSAVDMVELKMISGQIKAQIHINGKVKTSSRDPKDVIKEIQNSMDDKWQQHGRH